MPHYEKVWSFHSILGQKRMTSLTLIVCVGQQAGQALAVTHTYNNRYDIRALANLTQKDQVCMAAGLHF
jgi:hypothetical protein